MPSSRRVDVAPQRLRRWVDGFTDRHGEFSMSAEGYRLVLTGADGALAVLDPPFPPLPAGWADADPLAAVQAHASADRRVGVVLVRLGGYAIGIFDGERLVASKVGARPVHGRSAAGGWSQHRFARRREGQVRVALDAAAVAALGVLAPAASSLDALVTGGDRRAVAEVLQTVLADVRLASLAGAVASRVLDVPDPRLRVLQQTPAAFRAVRITVTDPPLHDPNQDPAVA